MKRWLQRVCLLLLFANIGALSWHLRHPTAPDAVHLPPTEPGTPGLILQQEYLQLERGQRRLTADACWQLGPFADEAAMRRAWQSLEYLALDLQTRRTEALGAAAYRLRVPAAASRADAELLRESLLAAGFARARIAADHGIDLGVYAELAEAESRQRIAQQLGLEVLLRAEQARTAQWWIDASVRNAAGFRQWLAEQTPPVVAAPCR